MTFPKNTLNPRARTLIFPALHPDGISYYKSAIERGEHCILATSVGSTTSHGVENNITILPTIYGDSFLNELSKLLFDQQLDAIYCPVVAVYAHLKNLIISNKLDAVLIGPSPIRRQLESYDALIDDAQRILPFISQCSENQSVLDGIGVASVLRLAKQIYGESNEDKISSMISIFSSAPTGDVVEIGSLAGRSAAVLLFLSKIYKVGNVLAVDPWESFASRQDDSPSIVRDQIVDEWDFESLVGMFIVNTLPLGIGLFNYLRKESKDGARIYHHDLQVQSRHFGLTKYSGKISVLHIDGNHDYSKVKLDCELWIPSITAGGWLILDDYIWMHGDGPHRIGDALLSKYEHDIERSFVCGKALFVQLRNSIKFAIED